MIFGFLYVQYFEANYLDTYWIHLRYILKTLVLIGWVIEKLFGGKKIFLCMHSQAGTKL